MQGQPYTHLAVASQAPPASPARLCLEACAFPPRQPSATPQNVTLGPQRDISQASSQMSPFRRLPALRLSRAESSFVVPIII